MIMILYQRILFYLNDSHLEQHEYEKWEGHHLQMNEK